MPDVNLLKDTEGMNGQKKKPMVPGGQPELTQPEAPSSGMGGIFKSLFNRSPKPLPVMPRPSPVGKSALTSSGTTRRPGQAEERILSETKKAAPSVIPLPDEDETYNVNLLSEDLISTINYRQRGIVLGGAFLGAAALIALAYFGIHIYGQGIAKKTIGTEDELKQVKSQIASLTTQQLQAASVVQKLNAIQSLVDRHTRWTKFFALLERYTLPTVTYGSSFSGDLNGSLSLSATCQNYDQVAQQYLIFKQLVADKKFISNFSITGASSTATKEGGTQVNFVVSMTLLPTDFTVSSAEATTAASVPATNTNQAPTNSTSTPSNGSATLPQP